VLRVSIVVLLLGCHSTRDPLLQPTQTDLRPIESIPGLAQPLPENAKADCRLSSVVRARFVGQKVVPCGAVTDASGLPAWERTGRCLGAAVQKRLPFVAEHQEAGVDSDFRVATVGVLEGSSYVVFRLASDSDPCGGECPLDGGTSVERCTDLLSAKYGCNGADCAGCGSWVPEQPCDFKGPQKPESVEDILGPPDGRAE
jgi:hypothetical protein